MMFSTAVGRWLDKESLRGVDLEPLWEAPSRIGRGRMMSEQLRIGLAAASFCTERG